MTSKGYSKQEIDQLPEFYVSVAVDEAPLVWMHPIADPFVRQFVNIGWLDRLKSLFRREYRVEVSVTGNNAAVFNVMNARSFTRSEFARMVNGGDIYDSSGRLVGKGDTPNESGSDRRN